MPGQTRKTKPKYGLGRSVETHELPLPSGNLCRVTRPGIQGLIKQGVLDSLDSLTGLVQAELIDAKDPRKVSQREADMVKQGIKAMALDPKKLLEGLDLVDKVLVAVVVEPKVYLRGAEVPEEEDSPIYADEVDIEDKMFIFQYVAGGTRDLETFRKQSAELLGSLEV